MDRKGVPLQFELHLVLGIVGGNAKDSGEVPFWKETFSVVYCGYSHVGAG